jgi:hypothetical protein
VQLTDWPLVEVALQLVGLTQISFIKKLVLIFLEETNRLLDYQLSINYSYFEEFFRGNNTARFPTRSPRESADYY